MVSNQHLFNMNVSNFANPVEIIQFISIIGCVNKLSNFLYTENLLEEDDLYKKISVVNSLYQYFEIHKNDPDESIRLIRILLKHTDLYGEKENEDIDVIFANTMLKHVISSFVFEEFGNIHGFLAEVVRTSKNITIDDILNKIRLILKLLTFENEDGSDSVLSLLSADSIFKDIILPMFPLPKENLKIIKLDYIYAQAGYMFCQTDQMNPVYFSNKQISKFEINSIDKQKLFHEYVGVAHVIENLFIAGEIGKSTMSIFSLPALLHYVYKKRKLLEKENISDIVNDRGHWTKAYQLLFGYIDNIFNAIERHHERDYRHQLHLALANFKNRTMLAREQITRICSNVDEADIEKKVAVYLENRKNYQCYHKNELITLPNLHTLYDRELNEVKNKYFQFEKESIREAFNDIFEEPTSKFIIARGSFVKETIRTSDDLLEFYFTGYRSSIFYALIRKDYNVSLITELRNRLLFRQKLGVSDNAKFATNDFANPLKSFNEDFEVFLNKIAEQKAHDFEVQLHAFDFVYDRQNWWKEFGLSLIPFYSCITSSIKGNTFDSFFACPMDAIQLFSIVGEVENVITKITTEETRIMYSKLGANLETFSLRKFIQSAVGVDEIEIGKGDLLPEESKKQLFDDLGHVLMGPKDSGIEMGFLLNDEELSSISKLITTVESKLSVGFTSVRIMLTKTKELLQSVPKVTGEKFGKKVYVKTLDKTRVSGYGYKFIQLPNGNIAQIRHVQESGDEILVVFDGVTENNEKIYKELDIDTMKPKDNVLLVENDGILVKNPETTVVEITIPVHNEGKCYSRRARRSPSLDNYCIRTSILKEQVEDEEEAVDYAVRFGTHEESDIRYELMRYYFPPGKETKLDMVKEWMNNKIYALPAWSERYKIKKPQLFFDLRFKEFIGNMQISEEEAISIIGEVYSKKELNKIKISPIYIRYKYILKKAYYSTTFEDYFALANQQGLFRSDGYLRIGDNTNEGRRMRNALYRLAIRQMDNPVEEFPQKLFRGERRSKKVVDKLFASSKLQDDFMFGRFTSVSRNLKTAHKYALGRIGEQKVIYEINFSGNYLSAMVEKLHATSEEESLLLPKSKFQIVKVSKETDNEIGDHLRVVLKYKHENFMEDLKHVMAQLAKLKNSGTKFYHNELPKRKVWASCESCLNLV